MGIQVFKRDAGSLIYCADAQTNWQRPAQLAGRLTPGVRDWLTDSGSLTARLKSHSCGTFSVRVISEGWILANAAQRKLLEPRPVSQLMWSRHVQLCVFGEAWVAAHSLIPYSSMRGVLRQLATLRDRPLGGFLFEQPGLKRFEPQITRVNNSWGRRSVFQLNGQRLIVAEYFLPAMMDYFGYPNYV